MNKCYFQSKDHIKLCGIWHKPNVETSKAIVLAHGITVNKDEKGNFIRLAELFEKNGFAVFRFDFRGHGESEGNSIDLTVSGEVLDIGAAIDLVRQDYAEIGLLGASFGGGSSALYVAGNEDKLKCLCLWNPALNYDHCFLNPIKPCIKSQKDYMAKELKEKGWTTLGSRKFVIGRALWQEMGQYQPFNEIKKITIPSILIHGTKDTKVPYEDSVEYAGNLIGGNLITINGAEHGFHEKWESEIADQVTLKFFMENL